MFHCDEGATQAWGKLGSSNATVLDLMRRILTVAACGNFNVTLKHITGIDNCIADALSRFQEQRFRALAPLASPCPISHPEIFCDLRKTYT